MSSGDGASLASDAGDHHAAPLSPVLLAPPSAAASGATGSRLTASAPVTSAASARLSLPGGASVASSGGMLPAAGTLSSGPDGSIFSSMGNPSASVASATAAGLVRASAGGGRRRG